MRKLVAAALISSLCVSAHADVGVLAGLSYAFGSNTGVGFVVQATSSRNEDHGIVAAGISYYPFTAKPAIGLPVGVGYQGQNVGATVNYDFLLHAVSIGGGYVNTK